MVVSFLAPALVTNTSFAQSHPPQRPAKTHPQAKVIKKNSTHRRDGATKRRRAKHRPAAGPHLMASCGYSPRAVSALHSRTAYVLDVDSNTVLLARNARTVRPIASISKLMTAVVARDAARPLNGVLRITARDRDTIKLTGSRLPIGAELSRRDMFHIALMSSENRAASALGHDYPGGRTAFVKAMNREARRLGMRHTHFREPTGLSPHNVSTAEDLARLVNAAAQDPLIRYFSTDISATVYPGESELLYRNSNSLVRNRSLPILLQKTGFIRESGHSVVLRMNVKGRRETVVLLGAPTRAGVTSDAIKIHRWLTCSIR
ncbi:serine hydrolase [Burkholderia cepacia]|uniref:serine hydrolase n=1 Tax=Burkholderia cepacia TaxID=292 RepID=UPI0009BCFA82|nr:serine hydrolase [Burkholderia cepacia]